VVSRWEEDGAGLTASEASGLALQVLQDAQPAS
jgi:hypothetical protein